MQHEAKIHTTKPKDFPPEIQVAACYVEIDRQVLFLQYSPNKPEPGKWGVPAGKVKKEETPEEAAKRELFEETGISAQTSQIKPRGPIYILKPHVAYTFHLFERTARRNLGPSGPSQASYSTICGKELTTHYRSGESSSFQEEVLQIRLAQKPRVQISNEHSDYIWASEQDLATLPLMEGALAALQHYRISVAQGKMYSQEGLI